MTPMRQIVLEAMPGFVNPNWALQPVQRPSGERVDGNSVYDGPLGQIVEHHEPGQERQYTGYIWCESLIPCDRGRIRAIGLLTDPSYDRVMEALFVADELRRQMPLRTTQGVA